LDAYTRENLKWLRGEIEELTIKIERMNKQLEVLSHNVHDIRIEKKGTADMDFVDM